MDLHVLVGSGAGVPEHVGVDAHPARLLAVTPASRTTICFSYYKQRITKIRGVYASDKAVRIVLSLTAMAV